MKIRKDFENLDPSFLLRHFIFSPTLDPTFLFWQFCFFKPVFATMFANYEIEAGWFRRRAVDLCAQPEAFDQIRSPHASSCTSHQGWANSNQIESNGVKSDFTSNQIMEILRIVISNQIMRQNFGHKSNQIMIWFRFQIRILAVTKIKS